MLDTSNIAREPLIAGSNSGKPVRITPQAKPVYDELVKLARRGNHWARISVKGINELAAGRLHQKNIFIKPTGVHRGGTEEFVVILPGCKVTVEKLPQDGFRILHFDADVNYFELQVAALKPALYKAEKGRLSAGWNVTLQKRGQLRKDKNRIVGVSDGLYDQPSAAAENIAPKLSKASFAGDGDVLNDDGFDFHYTPGKKRIGGLVNYRDAVRPLNNTAINESAILLAKTMYDSKDIPGVGWVSEFGGSAVLTQAMKILADQGVKLDKHRAFMVRPRTSVNEAVKQAHRLNLKIPRNFTTTGALDYIGNRDQLELIGSRLKSEVGYDLKKASADVFQYGGKLQGGGSLLAAAGVALTAAPAVPAILTYLAAIAGQVGVGAKIGNTVVEQIAPNTHDRIKGKF